MIDVVVVGSGAAGLCAAKLMSERADVFNVVVYEQSGVFGGIWNYTDLVGGVDSDGLPVTSTMYKSLRTNLPKEVMAFPDFPFPDYNGRSYLHHTEMLQYLKDYYNHFQLSRFIKFYTKVEEIKPRETKLELPQKWMVRTLGLQSKERETVECDAVILCVGHYSKPKYPKKSGLESFSGKVMHSHNYRTSKPFEGQKVVLFGAGPSGLDLALEIVEVADEVYLSHNLPFQWLKECSLRRPIREVPGIDKINYGEVIFKDGTSCIPDVLILCTGYTMDLGSLHEDCRPIDEDERMTPLYQHMIHIRYPSLAILGVPLHVVPFLTYQQQLTYFFKFLDGSVTLPAPDEMLKNADKDFQRRLQQGMAHRHAHRMDGDFMWDYFDELSSLGNFPSVPSILKSIYEEVNKMRKKLPNCYRDFNVVLKSKDSFQFKKYNSEIQTEGLH